MVNVLSIHCLLIIVNLHFHIYEGVHAYSFLFLQLHFSSLIKFYTFLFHSPIFCLSYFCYACKLYLFFSYLHVLYHTFVLFLPSHSMLKQWVSSIAYNNLCTIWALLSLMFSFFYLLVISCLHVVNFVIYNIYVLRTVSVISKFVYNSLEKEQTAFGIIVACRKKIK